MTKGQAPKILIEECVKQFSVTSTNEDIILFGILLNSSGLLFVLNFL